MPPALPLLPAAPTLVGRPFDSSGSRTLNKVFIEIITMPTWSMHMLFMKPYMTNAIFRNKNLMMFSDHIWNCCVCVYDYIYINTSRVCIWFFGLELVNQINQLVKPWYLSTLSFYLSNNTSYKLKEVILRVCRAAREAQSEIAISRAHTSTPRVREKP